MSEVQNSEARAWLQRRLQEVQDEIGDLEPRLKDLKAERRGLRLGLGFPPGQTRQRKPKVAAVEQTQAAAE